MTSLAGLLREAQIAAGDVKTLLEALCPPTESHGCDTSFDAAEPERLFDCAIAAYLLESNRSSYDLPGLSADYLTMPLPHVPDEAPPAALQANATRHACGRARGASRRRRVHRRLPHIEMPLVPVLARMERVGVGLDRTVLDAIGEEASGQIDALRAEIWELAGDEFTIDSPKQLSEVLFDKLGLPPQKKIKTGFSTDSVGAAGPVGGAPDLRQDPRVPRAHEAQVAPTSMRCPQLIAEDGRLHTSFNQTVAATGRLSSSNPNLQNIPVRTELGAAFARPSSRPSTATSSSRPTTAQIELRILAHLSGDQGLSTRSRAARTSTRPPPRGCSDSSRGRWTPGCARGPRRSTSASCTGRARTGSRSRSASAGQRRRR